MKEKDDRETATECEETTSLMCCRKRARSIRFRMIFAEISINVNQLTPSPLLYANIMSNHLWPFTLTICHYNARQPRQHKTEGTPHGFVKGKRRGFTYNVTQRFSTGSPAVSYKGEAVRQVERASFMCDKKVAE